MAKRKLKKAFFITLEGAEGSGKSTVIKFLSAYFRKQGLSFKVFYEPGSTAVGNKIRDILLDKKNKISPYTELLLYLAARTQLIEEKLFKALLKYDIVICDRFFDSTVCYQGYALGLGEIAFESAKKFSLGVMPDLTLLFDIQPSLGLRRLEKKDRIESRPLKFHNKLREGYLKLAKKYPRRIKVIFAGGRLEDIFKQVESVVSVRLKRYLRAFK